MKFITRACCAIALLCSFAFSSFAQDGQRKDRVQFVDGRAAYGTTISVCAYNSVQYSLVNGVWTYTGAVPCSPMITIYSDPAGAHAITPPLLSDSQGNFSYWVTPTIYTECVTGSNITGSCYAVQVGGSGGGGGGTPGGIDTNIQVNGAGIFIGPSGLVYTYGATPPVLSIPGNLQVKSGQPWYDVTAWGAKCDGSTDDTAAINAVYAQVAADLAAGGGNQSGGGTVYFPHSTGPCKFSTITIPTQSKGWIVSVFDTGLIGNTFNVGGYTAFIGHSGNFQGQSGSYLFAPSATWANLTAQSAPLVNIANLDQVYFEGINFAGASSSETILIGGTLGAFDITFNKCVFNNSFGGYDIIANPASAGAVSGYSLFIDKGSLQGTRTLILNNFAFIKIRDSFLGGGTITVNNEGIPSDGGLILDNDISEGLTGDLVLLTGSYVNDVTIRGTQIADPVGTTYMYNDQTTGNPHGPVHFDMNLTGNIGSGLIDPASIADHVYCEGLYASGLGCPAYKDTIAQLASTPAPPVDVGQDRYDWFDTFDNWRCITHSGANCGAIFGSITESNFTGTLQPVCETNGLFLAAGCPAPLVPGTVTNQVFIAQNGAAPIFASMSVPSNLQTGGTYSVFCDSGTTTLDRGKLLMFNDASGVTVTVPDQGSTGCVGMTFAVGVGNGGGTATFNRTTSSQFAVLNGVTAPALANSFTLTAGQYATLSPDSTGGNYEVREVSSGSCGGSFSAHTFCGNNTGSSAAASASAIGTQDYSPNSFGTGGGTANAQTVTLPVPPTSYVPGLYMCWIPANANTGATNVNVNGLGVVNLDKSNGSTLGGLAANDLVTNVEACAVYYGSSAFQLLNPQTNATSGNTIVSSPQYEIPFYSSSGTSNALTGSGTIITDSPGNLYVTASSSSSVTSSQNLFIQGTYQNSSSPTYAADQWSFQNTIGSGTNGTSTLTIGHGGTSGATSISFPGLNFNSGAIKANLAATPVTVQSGLNGSGTQALLTLMGGNVTGGSAAVKGGNVLIQGGSDASTSASSFAGSVQLEAGSSSSSGSNGILQDVLSFAKGTTVTAGNLECFSAAMTVADCGASPTNVVCIAQGTVSASPISCVSSGEVVVNSSNAATVGHTVCAGSTSGEVTDSGGTSACTLSTGIGIVAAVSGTWTLPDGSSAAAGSTTPLIVIVRD